MIRLPLSIATLLIVILTVPQIANAAPKIEQWTTENGARIYFVAAHELPMLDIKLVFDAGSARNGSQEGLASLTNTLLDQGAGSMDADHIAEKLEGLGAELGSSSYRDMAIVSLRSLTDPELLHPALDTLALVVGDPTFPDDAFAREQQRTLVAIRSQKESPSATAGKAFYRAIYGNHPYAAPILGTEESVAKLTSSDVQNFYRRYYVAANAVVAIVGDVDRRQAEEIAEKVTSRLGKGQPAPDIPPVEDLDHSSTERISHPSKQTHILAGQPGIERLDPDYFPLYVGNHVLGGNGLVSRISEEIREKRGLSYNAYSYFAPMHGRGPFLMGLQTRNDQADDALALLRKVLEKFVRNGPTAKELKAAQQNITGSFALSIASNGKIADQLAMIGFFGLPLDYLDTFNDHVNAVTVASARTAFQRHIHPDRMATVIVGAPVANDDKPGAPQSH